MNLIGDYSLDSGNGTMNYMGIVPLHPQAALHSDGQAVCALLFQAPACTAQP